MGRRKKKRRRKEGRGEGKEAGTNVRISCKIQDSLTFTSYHAEKKTSTAHKPAPAIALAPRPTEGLFSSDSEGEDLDHSDTQHDEPDLEARPTTPRKSQGLAQLKSTPSKLQASGKTFTASPFQSHAQPHQPAPQNKFKPKVTHSPVQQSVVVRTPPPHKQHQPHSSLFSDDSDHEDETEAKPIQR